MVRFDQALRWRLANALAGRLLKLRRMREGSESAKTCARAVSDLMSYSMTPVQRRVAAHKASHVHDKGRGPKGGDTQDAVLDRLNLAGPAPVLGDHMTPKADSART
jgi:hypothetical protein